MIRPLHECFRNEIEEYSKHHNLEFCTDGTNHEKNYLRNRVRLELLPILERYNPKIKSSLNETSRLLRDDENYLEGQVEQIFTLARIDLGVLEQFALKVDIIRSQHPAMQKRLVRHAISGVKGDLRSISARHVSDILQLISYSKGSKE